MPNPPGTEWLDQNRRMALWRQKLAQVPGLQQVDWSTGGDPSGWQFALDPGHPKYDDLDAWYVMASPPGTSAFHRWTDQGFTLPQALRALGDLRANGP